MSLALRTQFPIRIIVGQEDITQYVEAATFSTVDPGGCESCSLTVPRDLPDTIRGLPIRITTGLATVWEGRVSQIQRSLGARTLITGQGYAALLADVDASIVFVERDLTRWSTPPLARQIALASSNKQLGSSQVAADPDTNTPAIVQSIVDSWVAPNEPINESWYDSGPQNTVAQVFFDLTVNEQELQGDSAWSEIVGIYSDGNLTAGQLSNQLHVNSPHHSPWENRGYFTPTSPQRFAFLQHVYEATPGGAQGTNFAAFWASIAAYGPHGLTGRGTDPVGFYPSDIFGWVVSQVPGVQDGVIQQTDGSGYIVPHSAYYSPVTLDTIAKDMATAQGWHWGVWPAPSPLTGDPRPRADFRPRPAPGAFTAFCHRRDCDTLDIREDLSGQYNEGVVTFTDTAGVQAVAIALADNPILLDAGIELRTAEFNGGTMDPAAAQLFAAESLLLTNIQARVAGSANIIAAIDGGTRAPWTLQPGIDRLRIGDAPTTTAFGEMSDYPITRMEASITESGFTTSVELGLGGAQLIEVAQARLAAATFLAGNGG